MTEKLAALVAFFKLEKREGRPSSEERPDYDKSLEISDVECSSNREDIVDNPRTEMDPGKDGKLGCLCWRNMVAGGLAGTISRTCTAPVDRLKVLQQVHGGRKQTSIPNTVRYMLNEGGIRGLWRGNGINVLKMTPENALKFGVFEEVKKMMRGSEKREMKVHERLVAGSCAGAFSQSAIYPLEVLKTRLALRKTGEMTGVVRFAKDMFAAEGLKVFYKGYWPNLFGIIPYAGIDLAVYETLKEYYLKKNVQQNDRPSALLLLCCGTFRQDLQ